MPEELKHHWPEGLEQGEFYDRTDCCREAMLRVFIGEDGDAYATIIQDVHHGTVHKTTMAGARFCTRTGGGKSPRVRQALINLAEAIRLDNLENPQPQE